MAPATRKWIDCPACGNDPEERKTCRVCRGSGKIEELGMARERLCPNCNCYHKGGCLTCGCTCKGSAPTTCACCGATDK
jgi:hypothetical protein